MPGYGGRLDSSTDDDYEDLMGVSTDSPVGGARELSPCDLVFEGAGVVIGGVSNLQRQPKTKKVSFLFIFLFICLIILI